MRERPTTGADNQIVRPGRTAARAALAQTLMQMQQQQNQRPGDFAVGDQVEWEAYGFHSLPAEVVRITAQRVVVCVYLDGTLVERTLKPSALKKVVAPHGHA